MYVGDFDKPINMEYDAYKLLGKLQDDDPILEETDEATYSEAQMIAFAIKFHKYMTKENKIKEIKKPQFF